MLSICDYGVAEMLLREIVTIDVAVMIGVIGSISTDLHVRLYHARYPAP